MSGRRASLCIPEDVRAAIEETAQRTGRKFSSMANEMLSEAVKMRRFSGIVFAEGPTGRRARIAGTGIDVFEVVGAYRSVGQDWAELRKAMHWLAEDQLRTALAYADAYPDEIEEHVGADDPAAFEAFWAAYPATKPPWR